MKDLKITKGKWVGVDYAGHNCLQIAPFYGARDLLDENNTHEAEANMMLCCDAGNTAQKCGLLPSELLKQRDELMEALKKAHAVIIAFEVNMDAPIIKDIELTITNTERDANNNR